MQVHAPHGLLLVVSSPSGAGKTTLSRRLVREHPELGFSISYTTRLPRPGEVQDVDYHFVGEAEFDAMIAEGAFAEWAHVHGRRYGTAIATIRRALDQDAQVMFDIDYQGAERLHAQFPAEARLVFILPPSMAVLEQRLRARGTDAPEVIDIRMRKAREEIAHFRSYDYLIVNDDIERAYAELSAIYEVSRQVSLVSAGGQKNLPAGAWELASACAQPLRAACAESLIAEAARRD